MAVLKIISWHLIYTKKLEDELGLFDYHYLVLERETGFNILERNRGGYNGQVDTLFEAQIDFE